MKNQRLWQFLLFFSLLLYSGNIFADAPEGQLYWLVREYQNAPYLYDLTLPYDGASAALEAACKKNAGGTYAGTINYNLAGTVLPAKKAAYCMIRFFSSTLPGRLYYVELYCNGEKRYEMDDSPCPMPEPPFEKEPNQGPPPPCNTPPKQPQSPSFFDLA